MQYAELNAAANLVTLIVIIVTAIAAMIQLRHMRASNQLQGLLTVLDRVESANFSIWIDEARRFVPEHLSDPAYRRSIEDGTFERSNNPWLNIGNAYEWVGSLVRQGLIGEDHYLDIYAGRVISAWELVEETVAIARRRGGPGVLENFEYLYVRATAYLLAHPTNYPDHVPRAIVHDKWAEADAALRAAQSGRED